jgi:hypothetical protein
LMVGVAAIKPPKMPAARRGAARAILIFMTISCHLAVVHSTT